jgi:hypothetical protein
VAPHVLCLGVASALLLKQMQKPTIGWLLHQKMNQWPPKFEAPSLPLFFDVAKNCPKQGKQGQTQHWAPATDPLGTTALRCGGATALPMER